MKTKLTSPELQELKRFAVKNIRTHGLPGIQTALDIACEHLTLQKKMKLAKEFQDNFDLRTTFAYLNSNLGPTISETTGYDCVIELLQYDQKSPQTLMNNNIRLLTMTISIEIPSSAYISNRKNNSNNDTHNNRKVVPLHAV